MGGEGELAMVEEGIRHGAVVGDRDKHQEVRVEEIPGREGTVKRKDEVMFIFVIIVQVM